MFQESDRSSLRLAIGHGQCPALGESHAPVPDPARKRLKRHRKSPYTAARTTTIRRQLPLAASLVGLLLLGACGFNGTDPDEGDKSAEVTPAAAPQASGEGFEEVALADSEPRPIMQVQVVLDRQGFGPGVIDGREGLSTTNALKGFQEANGLEVTGELDVPTRGALARWDDIAATRVIRVPDNWGREAYHEVPDEPADQAKMTRLGYASIDERLAERFHTTVEVLHALNPGGRPAGMAGVTRSASPAPSATPSATPVEGPARPLFRAGQLVRVPNAGADRIRGSGNDADWTRTLASLGIDAAQPEAARVVVDKSDGWLKAYDADGKLLALFTVTTGSRHDPLPLGEWRVNGVARNPPFAYDPDLFWDVPDHEEEQQLPPGPNGPVGVVWIDITKEHYGIHGTPDPETIGRAQSHGCVRLTNWDAARLAGMVDGSTKVVFQA
jgi:lipoprotein-anchoring transpeptidase ErfK/SrfK